jgi:hypothetical protein
VFEVCSDSDTRFKLLLAWSSLLAPIDLGCDAILPTALAMLVATRANDPRSACTRRHYLVQTPLFAIIHPLTFGL